jgi:chromosome segregation protein
MYISDLELHGFKSFAHKTHVKFDNGITAIVGPNGCGKSNIVDALRWVLGEQRPTLLRSSSMSNVIFNGTAKKNALGMADVSLTFVNNKGILPVEYSELTITRRLYRSGDSEYLINNTPCRLKDIMELFMDTGMSSDAYSVIELKMVEEILNDRNNDRRKLFEEAAGVTRYKEKRKQTLRKLDETLKDLQRLEDLLVEIRKKARSLERQAEKAVKAKRLKTELVHLDKAYNKHEYERLQNELTPLNERISKAEEEKRELAQSVQKLELAEEKARNTLLEKEKAEAEAKRVVSQLHSAIRELQTGIEITSEKIKNEKSVIQQYRSDVEQSNSDLKELKELKESAEKQLEKLQKEKKTSKQSLEQSKETFSEVQQKYSSIRHDLYELEISISDVNQKLTALQSSRIKLESKLENSENDEVRILRDIENFEDEIANAKGELGLLREKKEKAYGSLDEKEEKLERITAEKSEAERNREHLRDEIRTLKSRLDAVESEKNLLTSLAESNDALPESVAYLKKHHSAEFDLLESVGDVLQTSQEYTTALETALGEAINYVVVSDFGEARKAALILKEQEQGEATFIPLNALNKSYPLTENSVADLIRTKPEFEPVASLLLGSIAFAETQAEAEELVTNRTGVSAVARSGELINAHRFLKGGSKKKQTGIRLGLQDKLEKLEAKGSRIQKELAEKKAELQQTQEVIASLDPSELRKDIKQVQQTGRELEQKMSRFQSQIQVYEKNISDLKTRKESLSGNRNSAVQELEELHPRQKEYQQKITELSRKKEEQQEKLQSLEEERAIAQNRYNDARLKHQDMENKAENIRRDIDRATSGIENIGKRLESRMELMDASKKKIVRYEEEIENSKQRLAGLKEKKQEADEKLSAAEKASARQRGEINEYERELKDIQKKKEVNLELVHHLTMAKEKLEMQAQGISDHIWETYEILMDQLEEELGEELEPAEAKERIAAVRQKLNRIGEVNPLAIEEYEEEKERLDFYEEQIEDLHGAEKEMRETIREINQTATARFNETFDKIRANFKTVFNTLFHEDDFCDLIIEEDSEDPLEAKIDIKANPKGKRPSSINQLSGGEKTLTAIALLFAIYLVKPSPFCVLDEVDAPLDDANIERFSQMIRKFSDDTQFIIITHNKKTMAKAEMMYGVTMPETGVSRLVGVKLDEVEEV